MDLCACAREQSCMKSDERFFFPCVVPAWLALTLVAVAGAHTNISKKKKNSGCKIWLWLKQMEDFGKFFFQKLRFCIQGGANQVGG